MNNLDFFYPLGARIMGGLRRIFGLQTGSPNAYAGPSAVPVTFDTAMQLSTVWACVKLLAETIASMPVEVKKGRKIVKDHPLSFLFSGKMNRYQTRIEFFETVILNLVVHGNSYCVKQKVGGRIVALLPIMAAQVEVNLLKDGSVTYTYTHDAGVMVYAAESIWHLKNMGNGIVGMSTLDFQRNSLGIAQAAEDATTKLFSHGAKPSGTLNIDRVLTKEQRAMVRENFSGLAVGNDERMLILEKGMEFKPVSMTPEDIELLASRQFQIADICRWYGVPSVMVNDTNGATVWGSGIAQIVEGFYKLTIRPIIEKIELSAKTNLLEGADRTKYDIEFDFNALLRGDKTKRYADYRVGIQGGFLTPNEARDEEGLPTDNKAGDQLFMQGATIPLDKVGQTPAPTESAKPPEEEPAA